LVHHSVTDHHQPVSRGTDEIVAKRHNGNLALVVLLAVVEPLLLQTHWAGLE
jgi:hypothetical protein